MAGAPRAVEQDGGQMRNRNVHDLRTCTSRRTRKSLLTRLMSIHGALCVEQDARCAFVATDEQNRSPSWIEGEQHSYCTFGA